MSKRPAEKHLAAIESGTVEKSNVIGLRKLFNAADRLTCGYSVSRTAPRIRDGDDELLMDAIQCRQPRIVGELHDTGLKLLRSARYRKRLAPVAGIIARLDHFRIVSFDYTGSGHVPVYEAVADDGRSFTFRNVPWQSGGDGPELL